MISEADRARFFAKTEQRGECLIWTGAMRCQFYGIFSIGKKNFSAHRFAYEIYHGSIPDGKWILHACDNGRCVAKAHLEAGTQSKNLKDCVARGRHIPPSGERNGQSKLTWNQVAEIRRDYRPREVTMDFLARKHGVSLSVIHSVVHGKRWKESK